MIHFIEIIEHTLIDSLKILPFLFITYLIMEYIEHKTTNKTQNLIQKSGKFGPFLGSILGVFPQCGFSAAASNLYAGRVITFGTLIAIFLSTSDEMLPIFISNSVEISVILKILGIKILVGMISGFAIDFFLRFKEKKALLEKNEESHSHIEHMCEHDHCGCEHNSILKSSLLHTLNIFVYIVIITFLLNIVIHIIGEDSLSNFLKSTTFLGPVIASVIGLIPNCASSVVLTELYLSNVISTPTMLSGLLVGSGVGLLVLFRSNKNIKENLKITLLLYIIGVVFGILFELMGLTI